MKLKNGLHVGRFGKNEYFAWNEFNHFPLKAKDYKSAIKEANQIPMEKIKKSKNETHGK